MATSFKVEILNGQHQFGSPTLVSRTSLTAPTTDSFKLALYTSTATMDASTAVYTTTNELTTAGNYSAGGTAISINQVPTSTTTIAWLDFADTSWATATFTARGAMIYNSTQINVTGRTVAVLDFGADKTATAGTFTVVWPVGDSSTAIIRIT
tara:strand:- start:739 stop:1197 length:459 start_codon:yes stop_codon:yes gene_type:complete